MAYREELQAALANLHKPHIGVEDRLHAVQRAVTAVLSHLIPDAETAPPPDAPEEFKEPEPKE